MNLLEPDYRGFLLSLNRLRNDITHNIRFLAFDFRSYVECQSAVGKAYLDPERWTKMAIFNIARMGKFSSDRTIREYARDIWQAQPVST